MAESTLYQFTGSTLEPVDRVQGADARVVAADSWRVKDGYAVAVEWHRARFARSIADHRPELSRAVEDFFSEMVALIPPTGEWFPRVECVETSSGAVFRFLQRVAPPQLTEVVLATAANDPRTTPTTKGPDLDALMALRRSVSATGATEAVIVTEDTVIAEGAYSSLVAWSKNGQELWVVDPAIPRIASVTEAVLVDIAHEQGVRVSPRQMTPADLEGHAVWILSALHGIRVATDWVDGPTLAKNDDLAAAWRALRHNRARNIHGIL
jgi:branched-subunit amino acid aminotransferase/4-amino-4-deoxychorismate lyase